MRCYQVSEVAGMAGVSVRTLHHYHQIGLLSPAYIGANGYRYYGRDELLRLQQILIHRELGLTLSEIARILDAPDFDRLEALKRQRDRIARQASRFAKMLTTIDQTIAELEGDVTMDDRELYAGIVDPEKQAEYERWLEKRLGPEIRSHIEDSRTNMESLRPSEREALMAELQDIEQELAAALRNGIPPESEALASLIARHRDWVAATWGRDCPAEVYASLADYYEHPEFQARYERIEAGFAGFLGSAMRHWARQQK